jgi:hypothetical protein
MFDYLLEVRIIDAVIAIRCACQLDRGIWPAMADHAANGADQRIAPLLLSTVFSIDGLEQRHQLGIVPANRETTMLLAVDDERIRGIA